MHAFIQPTFTKVCFKSGPRLEKIKMARPGPALKQLEVRGGERRRKTVSRCIAVLWGQAVLEVWTAPETHRENPRIWNRQEYEIDSTLPQTWFQKKLISSATWCPVSLSILKSLHFNFKYFWFVSEMLPKMLIRPWKTTWKRITSLKDYFSASVSKTSV